MGNVIVLGVPDAIVKNDKDKDDQESNNWDAEGNPEISIAGPIIDKSLSWARREQIVDIQTLNDSQ